MAEEKTIWIDGREQEIEFPEGLGPEHVDFHSDLHTMCCVEFERLGALLRHMRDTEEEFTKVGLGSVAHELFQA
ncbi:MAG: hypothetical protein EOM25_15075, partial [Deltaproteobacteria bacterium]|nr:hypothetical protein [Deltaproteobacteria bacterium]